MAKRSLSDRRAALQAEIQTLSNDSLLLIVSAQADVPALARDELVARGIGPDGLWHPPDALDNAWNKH